MYLYVSHLGGYFTTEKIISDTYCEQCGDSDFLLGRFETEKQKEELIEEYEND